MIGATVGVVSLGCGVCVGGGEDSRCRLCRRRRRRRRVAAAAAATAALATTTGDTTTTAPAPPVATLALPTRTTLLSALALTPTFPSPQLCQDASRLNSALDVKLDTLLLQKLSLSLDGQALAPGSRETAQRSIGSDDPVSRNVGGVGVVAHSPPYCPR